MIGHCKERVGIRQLGNLQQQQKKGTKFKKKKNQFFGKADLAINVKRNVLLMSEIKSQELSVDKANK